MTSQPSATGAQPAGATDERSAAASVRQMFNSIAPRYDLLNHVLSANIDRLWWRRTARSFRSILARPDAVILDLCCGTGDMTMALLRLRPKSPEALPILAADFAHEMLRRGSAKFSSHGAVAIEADALCLPLRDQSVDLITTAFGFRNLSNYTRGLQEFARVLRPGGQLGILDFSEPDGLLGRAYQMYFRRIVPAIGRALYGQSGPYEYLPESVRRFPSPEQLIAQIHAAGFHHTQWTPYSFGIAGLYTATRSEDAKTASQIGVATADFHPQRTA
jgi:demethylmenaquinone methyltransferase/2-methoxy-6-polyprenyl-1,4-benzoquinol methylase